MKFRRSPAVSPWLFISMFGLAAVAVYFLSNTIPFFNWTFLGIVVPLGASILVAVSSGIYGKWDEGKEFFVAGLGVTVGGGFALYIIPLVVR